MSGREYPEELIDAILAMVGESPEIGVHRIAKNFGVPLMPATRILHLMAVDEGALDGPALVALSRKSDTSMSTKVSLTEAGRARWRPA